MTPPWPGLGSYAVTKAALDKLVEAWRVEQPSVGFTRVVVGDCAGGEGAAMTQFANEWDPELAAEVMPTWMARNYIAGNLLDVEELVRVVDYIAQGRRGHQHPVGDGHAALCRLKPHARNGVTVDLSHSEDDEQFRTQFRDWLDANLPPQWRTDEFWATKTWTRASNCAASGSATRHSPAGPASTGRRSSAAAAAPRRRRPSTTRRWPGRGHRRPSTTSA